jgi:hypothetical protein
MNLDNAIFLIDCLAQILVIFVLAYRKMWRTFPLFCAYNVWCLASGCIGITLFNVYSGSSRIYATSYFITILLDSAFTFAVIVEVCWSVLKPLRGSLPKRALLVVIGVIVGAGAAIWPISALHMDKLNYQLFVLLHVKQVIAILAFMAFVVMAAGSQALSIGWRDRELQIVTGLGTNALVGMAVSVLHTNPLFWRQYNHLEELVVLSYFGSLMYWVRSFLQEEQTRRAMSPEMETVLLAMAGTARTARVAMAGSQGRSK